MKKAITFLVVTSALVASGVWVCSHVHKVTRTEERTVTTYVSVSPSDALIERINPRIDPSIRAVISRAIDRECLEQGLDTELVVSLINRESSFVPWAVSYKDKAPCAYGLMQVYPKAHPELCNNLTAAQLCNIDTNIRLGCAILKHYIGTSASIDEALGRYYGDQKATGYKLDILSNAATLYAMR